MVFNSFEFASFLLIVFTLFWIIPAKFKWILLLIASWFFYMYWNPVYILLLVGSTLVDYFLSLYLTGTDKVRKRRVGLIINLTVNLLVLFSFKYYNFFLNISEEVLNAFGVAYDAPQSNFLLPLGISFYTFQSISYSIDVYRKEIQPERNFFRFALFISFFPQLISGPIERAKNLLPQLSKKIFHFSSDNFKIGLFYILWGLFQKCVIADNCSYIVDTYFDNPDSYSGGVLTYAALLFAFQIYTDFAGYSNMAVGIAKLFDIELMANFNTPYLSGSLTDFWRRWHISLSLWFRDYLYIPLGGNRLGAFRTYLNLFVVFSVVGIWHGASYNFILWGLMHGVVLIIERIFKIESTSRFFIIRFFKVIFTFSLVAFIFVAFRVHEMKPLLDIYSKMLTVDWRDFLFWMADNRFSFAFLGIYVLIAVEVYVGKKSLTKLLSLPAYVLYPFCMLIFFMILLMGRTEGGQFIYFQF